VWAVALPSSPRASSRRASANGLGRVGLALGGAGPPRLAVEDRGDLTGDFVGRHSERLVEVAGFLGHSSGYKTTERYAKFGPDHLAGAVRAIDGYFADLGVAALPPPATHPLRVSSVLVPPRMGPYPIGKMVEPTGIEPVTSTMPLSRSRIAMALCAIPLNYLRPP